MLQPRSELPVDVPSQEDISTFWKEIVGVPGSFDPDDEAILAWKHQLRHFECSEDNVTIDTILWRNVVKKMKSWKAPGQMQSMHPAGRSSHVRKAC